MGDVGGGTSVLVRVHSECLTGDALGSLRCDCGIQLRQSLRIIAAEQRGVLIYATGHEGRGIGLLNKLRAYVAQDEGADTVDANHLLGLPADARDYTGAAAVLEALGIRSIRLLTNNPSKASGLRAAGTIIDAVVPLPTSAHHRNADYLSTKTERMGHVPPGGTSDVLRLLGDARAAARPTAGHRQVRPDARRPHRHLDGRLSLDQRRGRATRVARPPGGVRCRHGRRRHGPRRRPATHRPHGPRCVSSAHRPRQLVAHAAGRHGARRGRGDDDRHDGAIGPGATRRAAATRRAGRGGAVEGRPSGSGRGPRPPAHARGRGLARRGRRSGDHGAAASRVRSTV